MRNWTYKSGDWNIICDVCGRKVKASTAKHRWDGLIVCPDDYEERHSLDFIRARADLIKVPFVRDPVDEQLNAACDIPSRHSYPSVGKAGCMLPGFTLYDVDSLFSEFICTPESKKAKADIGTSDCATVGQA